MTPFDGLFDIRVLENDIRALPTEFKSNFLQSCGFGDFFAHGGGAGECDLIDSRVTHDCGAGDFTES